MRTLNLNELETIISVVSFTSRLPKDSTFRKDVFSTNPEDLIQQAFLDEYGNTWFNVKDNYPQILREFASSIQH